MKMKKKEKKEKKTKKEKKMEKETKKKKKKRRRDNNNNNNNCPPFGHFVLHRMPPGDEEIMDSRVPRVPWALLAHFWVGEAQAGQGDLCWGNFLLLSSWARAAGEDQLGTHTNLPHFPCRCIPHPFLPARESFPE